MGWLFGKKGGAGDKPRVIESEIPRDDDRYGPAPPPPRTAHAPGAAIHAFAEVPEQRLLRWGEGHAGFFLEGEEGDARTSALLVLLAPGPPSTESAAASAAATGGGAAAAAPPPPALGDVLIWDYAARFATAPPAAPSYSLEEIPRTFPPPRHHIRRDGLAGRGVSGITGLRTRHAGGGITVLRLGPPPGARWVFVGLSAIAVFAGRITLQDGEEARVVPAGHLALVADPTATLYVEAGNDSALAVALGGASVVSALG